MSQLVDDEIVNIKNTFIPSVDNELLSIDGIITLLQRGFVNFSSLPKDVKEKVHIILEERTKNQARLLTTCILEKLLARNNARFVSLDDGRKILLTRSFDSSLITRILQMNEEQRKQMWRKSGQFDVSKGADLLEQKKKLLMT